MSYFSEANKYMLFSKSLSPKCNIIVLFLLLKHYSSKAVCFTVMRVFWYLNSYVLQGNNVNSYCF